MLHYVALCCIMLHYVALLTSWIAAVVLCMSFPGRGLERPIEHSIRPVMFVFGRPASPCSMKCQAPWRTMELTWQSRSSATE